MEGILKDDASLYSARTGEFDVYLGYYPESLDWYLRMYVWDEYDDAPEYPGYWGDLDITGSPACLERLHSRLTGTPALRQSPAKRRFGATYGG